MMISPRTILYLLLLSASMASATLAAQATDYLVTAAGDTLCGSVSSFKIREISYGVYFRQTGADIDTYLEPQQVRSFRGKQVGRFVSSAFLPAAQRALKNKDYFLRPIVGGDVTVYRIDLRKRVSGTDGARYRYQTVYQVDDGQSISLVQDRAAFAALSVNNECLGDEEKYAYNEYSVGTYFVDATVCAGGQATLLLKEASIKPVDTRFRLYAAGGYYSYNWQPQLRARFANQTYRRGTRAGFALALGKMITSRGRVMAELSYAHYASEAVTEVFTGLSALDTTFVSFAVDHTILAPALFFSYHLPIGQTGTSAYATLGGRYAFVVGGQARITEATISRATSTITFETQTTAYDEEEVGRRIGPSDFVQVIAGLGVQFDFGVLAPFVELRYHNGQFIIPNQPYLYEELGVNVGLRF